MKERPILFSGPMVRAILSGTKTQTRRVVKCHILDHGAGKYGRQNIVPMKPCPYGQPGDRLWVREQHCLLDVVKSHVSGMSLGPENNNERVPDTWNLTIEYSDGTERDTSVEGERPKQTRERGDIGWRPSIHMPRWACRLVLEVVSVRVERLQDMHHKTGEFLAEGVVMPPNELYPDINTSDKLERHFIKLWNSINAKRAPWASNPLVWVVEFRRLP